MSPCSETATSISGGGARGACGAMEHACVPGSLDLRSGQPHLFALTQVYHPNIDLEGNVCLNILREDWKPVLTITSVVYGLNFLFLVRFMGGRVDGGENGHPRCSQFCTVAVDVDWRSTLFGSPVIRPPTQRTR